MEDFDYFYTMKNSYLMTIALSALTIPCFATSKQQPDTIPFAHVVEINPGDTRETILAKAAHVIPNERQVKGIDNEFIAFIHFGPNTFSGREWGTGMEDPALFNPSAVDAEQWVKTLKDAEVKMIILTVKHHDGYVLWQSRYTDHGIMQSPFMQGKGDVLRELADACRKYDMKLGIYLSPADLYQIESPDGLYGNGSEKSLRTIPRPVEGRPFENTTTFTFTVDDYNEYFLNQLFEVLTEYGPVHEVWFDGANPKEKGGQTYDYDAWLEVVHTLAPEAVVFGAGDVRWCGNEAGYTRDTEWNVVAYKNSPAKGTKVARDKDDNIGSIEMLEKGDYLTYVYPETDTSIRDGWFYRDDDKQAVRSADDVYDIYERSVGGNSILLLNVPPNKEGRFSPRDVEALEETGRRIRETYSHNLLETSSADPSLTDNDRTTGVTFDEDIVIGTPTPITFNRLVLQESVPVAGERIASHAVDARIDGEWVEIARATNVGNKRILRFPDVTTDSIRIRCIESRLTPVLSTVGAYYYPARPPQLSIARGFDGLVTIEPKRSDFTWKNALNEAAKNLSQGVEIHYTTDGSTPDATSPVYSTPFALKGKGTVKAVALLGDKTGAPTLRKFGYSSENWNSPDKDGSLTFDADPATILKLEANKPLTIDLGEKLSLSGLIYTPPTTEGNYGLIETGRIEVSGNGKKWEPAGDFEFGNILNDPSPRTFDFLKTKKARFIRIIPLKITENRPRGAIAEIELF